MNRDQINELNMMDTCDQVLTTYTSVWSSNAEVSTIISTLRGHLTSLNANDTLQKTSSLGYTQSKDEAKADMISAVLLIANAGKAYASVTNNTLLFVAMSHTKREITKAADTDADDICQNIHDAISPFIANTVAYGADATKLSNLQNTITNFSGLIGKPRQQRTIVSHATITIAQHFTAAIALLKNQLDTAMVQYQSSNAAFFNEYMSARVIIDIGHRHTVILKGFIYDKSDNALAGVLVTLSGDAKHKKTTDATGKYKFTRLHIGTYTLTVSKSGFATQTKTITVTENGTVETDFILEASGTAPVTNPVVMQ